MHGKNMECLDLPDADLEDCMSDWDKFNEHYKPLEELSVWKLKYFVQLAFARGWEARNDRSMGEYKRSGRQGSPRVLLEERS
jgi:hypothetical protein